MCFLLVHMELPVKSVVVEHWPSKKGIGERTVAMERALILADMPPRRKDVAFGECGDMADVLAAVLAAPNVIGAMQCDVTGNTMRRFTGEAQTDKFMRCDWLRGSQAEASCEAAGGLSVKGHGSHGSLFEGCIGNVGMRGVGDK